ncbi:MAG: SDR family NAD(P)-dependent oxidoreductase [Candidatus Brocadiia bacterium]|nr:MAG: SDR family NAD(P)-dependent oxidoreductase [Candidatus Brocadiia bacterium]
MDNTQKGKIELVAPIIRMLFAENSHFPVVRFSEKPPKDKICLKVSLPDEVTEEQAIEILNKMKQQRQENIHAVFVEGVGVFEIIPTQSNLTGRAAGKVAIVTGAAQGFGLAIAENLVSQGAYAVLADINNAEVQKQSRLLRDKYGQERAIAVSVNVTDPASITSAIHEIVQFYGGFDIFISNAGVLRAESVKTQSEEDFNFVTDVNYKGYFLCVQASSKILALQHKACPGYLGDIIQINSKSGLVGSNRNGSYAGSKFGGIGLTQSFALELIQDGIKVNCICPGNFFDGPLWSDPDNGLFVQYLRTGKVPGAKTIEDVKRFYESKVPFKRGCRASDVMAAVYYVIEQKYETGQAVPVTGGQIMLH